MIALKFVNIPVLPDFQEYDLKRKFIICGQLSERNPENISLLQNILRAVNLNMNSDVQALWMPSGEEWSLNVLAKHEQPHWLISFGIPPSKLGFNFEFTLNQSVQLANLNIIITSTFTQLNANQNAKKHLWEALKSHLIHV